MDDTMLLVRMAVNDGGRVDPARILRRPPQSHARAMFMDAQDRGWLDGQGWVTDAGRDALAADREKPPAGSDGEDR